MGSGLPPRESAVGLRGNPARNVELKLARPVLGIIQRIVFWGMLSAPGVIGTMVWVLFAPAGSPLNPGAGSSIHEVTIRVLADSHIGSLARIRVGLVRRRGQTAKDRSSPEMSDWAVAGCVDRRT